MDSLIAGAFAGIVVDLTLYPIDTIKTRIQAKEGFWASGGLRNIYKGLSAVAVGSVPGGAAFFFWYDSTKKLLFNAMDIDPSQIDSTSRSTSLNVIAAQSVAASVGECAACCIRVPTEMVKQQLQAGKHHSPLVALHCITNKVDPETLKPGDRVSINVKGINNLFRGMPIMLMREIPFSVIQMSLYEGSKRFLHHNESTRPYYYSLLPFCGAFSGGIAAFFTTPLDVIKTRIMLQHHHSVRGIRHVIRDIALEPQRHNDKFGVLQKFFRGAPARVFWISAGGSIFFSTYEYCKWSTNHFLAN